MSHWRITEPRQKDEDGWVVLRQRVDRDRATVTYTFYTRRKWWQFRKPKVVERVYGIVEIEAGTLTEL